MINGSHAGCDDDDAWTSARTVAPAARTAPAARPTTSRDMNNIRAARHGRDWHRRLSGGSEEKGDRAKCGEPKHMSTHKRIPLFCRTREFGLAEMNSV